METMEWRVLRVSAEGKHPREYLSVLLGSRESAGHREVPQGMERQKTRAVGGQGSVSCTAEQCSTWLPSCKGF